MAFQSIYYYTKIPDEIVDLIERDLTGTESRLYESTVGANSVGARRENIRNSFNTWIGTNHWIGGFMWHYVQRANRENFLYDLDCIEFENMQYTVYPEGTYYKWHTDSSIDTHYKPTLVGERPNSPGEEIEDFVAQETERIRKLSFSLQLSDPDTYDGGNLQIMNEGNSESYIVPREKGTIVIFDSRARHRVTKVTRGVRKSLVGWTLGPRWR